MLHKYIENDTFLKTMQHEMQHEIFWMGGVSIVSSTP
nr:MAG TPA: SprT-like family protein [Caudoviricetes sp.]